MFSIGGLNTTLYQARHAMASHDQPATIVVVVVPETCPVSYLTAVFQYDSPNNCPNNCRQTRAR